MLQRHVLVNTHEYDQLNEHKFEQTLGDSEGQMNLESCSPWGSELDMTW